MIDNHTDPITAHLAPGTEFGDYERAITSGFQMDKDTMEPMQPPPTTVDPLFYVEDSEATLLGRYLENGKPAFAVKRFDDWTSVYLGSPGVSADILRAIAKEAQAHLYVDGGDIVYANESFVAIHTAREGERVVHLRQRTDAYEVFDDQVLGRNASSVALDIPAFATKLIFLGEPDEFRKKLES